VVGSDVNKIEEISTRAQNLNEKFSKYERDFIDQQDISLYNTTTAMNFT